MSIAISVPKEYGYVLLTATGTFFLSTWHAMRVGPFRKAAGVPYPNQYASPEEIATAATPEKAQSLHLFNCAQRAHYNYLENYVAFLPAMLLAGLRFPVSAAVTGLLWAGFRTAYAVGYTRADKKNGKGRLAGSGFWLAQFVAFGMVGWMGWEALA